MSYAALVATETDMPIKRTLRVTIEKEIEIEIPDEYATEKYLEDFSRHMWVVDGVDDIVTFAARMAFADDGNRHFDFLGYVGTKHSTWPQEPDVKYEIKDEWIEYEFVG